MAASKNGRSADYVYKMALLRLLDPKNTPGKPQTLASLSSQLGLEVEETHAFLRDIFDTVGVDASGFEVFPFEIVYNEHLEDDETDYFSPEAPTPEAHTTVTLSVGVREETPRLKLTMRELVLVTLMIDDILELVPPGEDRETLKEIYRSFARAAEEGGYPSLLERSDDDVIAYRLLRTLEEAIRGGILCDITYSSFDEEAVGERRTVYRGFLPHVLLGGARPVLFGAKPAEGTSKAGRQEVVGRRLRLDRIGAVRPVEPAATRVRQRTRKLALKARRDDEGWRRQGMKATLRLDPRAQWLAEELAEADWHEDKGDLVGTIRFRNYGFLARLALQAGEYLVDVKPKAVREELARIFATLERSYE